MQIAPDSPRTPDVLALLQEHLAEMRATSPPGSVHALDPTALEGAAVTFVAAREDDGTLLGVGALSVGPDAHGELKSMRTVPAARGRGVAAAVLTHLLDEARARGLRRVSLETGSQEHFAPARRLYARQGFGVCGPFGAYRPDPHSTFMTLAL